MSWDRPIRKDMVLSSEKQIKYNPITSAFGHDVTYNKRNDKYFNDFSQKKKTYIINFCLLTEKYKR